VRGGGCVGYAGGVGGHRRGLQTVALLLDELRVDTERFSNATL
jgi:hypothetical protein